MSGANKHPYHLVEPSPWPAVGSAAAFVAVIGGVMFMHEVWWHGAGSGNHVHVVA